MNIKRSFIVGLIFFISAFLDSDKTDAFQSLIGDKYRTKPRQIDANAIPENLSDQSFVAFALMFTDSMRKSNQFGESTRSDLQIVAKKMVQLYNTMPTFQQIFRPRSPDPDYELKKSLQKEFGWNEGVRRFSKIRLEKFIKDGKIVSLKGQQRAVWKIIDETLVDKPEHRRFRALFLKAILIKKTGITKFFDDVAIARQLGLSQKDVESIQHAAKQLGIQYQKDIKSFKLQNAKMVWNVLDANQQQKFLRLLGRTEKVFLDIHTRARIRSLVLEWRGAIIDQFKIYYDGSDALQYSPLTVKVSKGIYKKGFRLTETDVSELEKLVDRGIKGVRMRFDSKKEHEKWYEARNEKLHQLLKYFSDNNSHARSKQISGKLKNLQKELAKFRRGSKATIADLRSDEPMIYYLVEHQKLSDDSTGLSIHGDRNTLPRENYFPFLVKNPYPKTVYPNRPVNKDDGFHQQALKTEELHKRWIAARSNVYGFSERVKVNNRFLRETKKLMLPHQYGQTFEWFFGSAGFQAMFHYHDVAKDFRMDQSQLNRLRKTTAKAAEDLEKEDRKLRTNAIQGVLKSIPKPALRKIQEQFDLTTDELVELLVPILHEPRLIADFSMKYRAFSEFRGFGY